MNQTNGRHAPNPPALHRTLAADGSERRQADLDLMLGAFGPNFLHHTGASITTALEDGRQLRLTRQIREAILEVPGSHPHASWVFTNLDLAVTAWLTYDGTTEPVGWARRT